MSVGLETDKLRWLIKNQISTDESRKSGLGAVSMERLTAAIGVVAPANLFVVPEGVAAEFEAFCRANPQACPLLAVGRAGQSRIPELGVDLDVATDLPSYLLHRAGVTERLDHLRDVWTDRSVAFAIAGHFAAHLLLRRRTFCRSVRYLNIEVAAPTKGRGPA